MSEQNEAIEPTIENGEGEENKTDELEGLTVEEQVAFWEEKAKYWKTHSRKNEQRFKEAAPLAEKWTQYEASQKPKEQQLAEELETLKAQIAERDRAILLNNIASELELPATAVKFLTGETEEELREAAKELKTLTASKDRTPAPNPLQGGDRNAPSGLSSLAQALKQNINN